MRHAMLSPDGRNSLAQIVNGKKIIKFKSEKAENFTPSVSKNSSCSPLEHWEAPIGSILFISYQNTYSCDRWNFSLIWRWMCDVSTNDYHGPLEEIWPKGKGGNFNVCQQATRWFRVTWEQSGDNEHFEGPVGTPGDYVHLKSRAKIDLKSRNWFKLDILPML